MCFDIQNPRDKSTKSLHDDANIKRLENRRNIQLSKLMFSLVSENKHRKTHTRQTRAMGTYVFDTDIVKLSIYANSPFYKGVQLWNDIPEDIKRLDNKHNFDCCIKNFF